MGHKLYKQIIINNKKLPYAVSRYGDILSLNYNHTNVAKELKLATDDDGYKTVTLHLNGKHFHCRVHRLVAMMYIKIPKKYLKRGFWYNDLEINHKDGDKTNNFVKNLEWCTAKENIYHAEITGLRKHKKGLDHPMRKYSETQIRMVCELLEENELPMLKICNKTDVDITTVYNIFTKNAWT